MSPSEKIIHFHINMNMSPYDLSPNAYYSYQSPFWYEISRWWQVWILHTMTFVTVWRLGMKIFHTCHQKSRSDGDGLIGFTIELNWAWRKCFSAQILCSWKMDPWKLLVQRLMMWLQSSSILPLWLHIAHLFNIICITIEKQDKQNEGEKWICLG